jgi:1,4-dihydroxy-6-naphthoate synthase
MKLTIGISPCPNDTFIFEHIYNGTFSIPNVELEFIFADVQVLNELANSNSIDIVKMSYANYFTVQKKYTLLSSGGALGFGVGPILVQKKGASFNAETASVAIPGLHTTANFLLQYLMPNIQNKTSVLFSEIEMAILNNKVDAGLLIHESRFTYEQKGLEKIADLGELWLQQTKLPIPLGCIAASNKINNNIIIQLNSVIKKSIIKSQTNYPIISEFVKMHAQEMDEQIMKQHIDLYVNEFSLDIGENGKLAINKMESMLKTI